MLVFMQLTEHTIIVTGFLAAAVVVAIHAACNPARKRNKTALSIFNFIYQDLQDAIYLEQIIVNEAEFSTFIDTWKDLLVPEELEYYEFTYYKLLKKKQNEFKRQSKN